MLEALVGAARVLYDSLSVCIVPEGVLMLLAAVDGPMLAVSSEYPAFMYVRMYVCMYAFSHAAVNGPTSAVSSEYPACM